MTRNKYCIRNALSLQIFSLNFGVVVLAIVACILIWLMQWTDVDVWLADIYYRPETHAFVWKNAWFAKAFMHQTIKNCIVIFGALWIFVTLIDLVKPLPFFNQWQRIRIRFVAISALFIPSLIAILKQFSTLHCPWDITRYGGHAPYLRLLESAPNNVMAGQCFPAGHASTGLWLVALCVFWLPHHPRKALAIFMLGLSLGFVLGWVQQMRGAHFLSHTLWSMWIASAVILLMLLFGQKNLNRNN